VVALHRPTAASPLGTALFDLDTRLVEAIALTVLKRHRILQGRQITLSVLGTLVPALVLLNRNARPQQLAFLACVSLIVFAFSWRLPKMVSRISVKRALATPGVLGPQEISFTETTLSLRRTTSFMEFALRDLPEIDLVPQGLLIVLGQGQAFLVPKEARIQPGDFDQFQSELLGFWKKERGSQGSMA
jgi:hypothetical protein